MGTEHWLYCRHCRQTLLAIDLEKCSACGKIGGLIDPTAPGALTGTVAAEQKSGASATCGLQQIASPLEVYRSFKNVYRLFKLGLAGLFCVGLGIALMVIPDLRSDPRNLSATEVVYGLAAVFAGVFLLALALVPFFISERPDSREAQPPNTNERA